MYENCKTKSLIEFPFEDSISFAIRHQQVVPKSDTIRLHPHRPNIKQHLCNQTHPCLYSISVHLCIHYLYLRGAWWSSSCVLNCQVRGTRFKPPWAPKICLWENKLVDTRVSLKSGTHLECGRAGLVKRCR